MENSEWNYWNNRAKAAEQNLMFMQVAPPLSLEQIKQAALTNEAALNAALGYYEKWGKQSPAKR